MIEYKISDKDLLLLDSYAVPKSRFSRELSRIKEREPDYQVWNRSFVNMENEWATHNFCYMVGLFRSRTKDCDLNYPQKWYERLVYGVVGCLVWWFIK